VGGPGDSSGRLFSFQFERLCHVDAPAFEHLDEFLSDHILLANFRELYRHLLLYIEQRSDGLRFSRFQRGQANGAAFRSS
jgi:hypothetical protein